MVCLPFVLSIFSYIDIYIYMFNLILYAFYLVMLISLFISFSAILLNVMHFYIKVYAI